MAQKQPKFVYEGDDSKIGVYSDFARVMNTMMTFSIEFAQLLPPDESGTPVMRVVSRIVMNPMQAKALLNTLAVNIKKYEEQYGEIKLPKENMPTSKEGLYI